MSMKYECWAYKNGKPDKMVNVVADNKSEAEALAWEKFKALGIKPDSVNCKWYKWRVEWSTLQTTFLNNSHFRETINNELGNKMKKIIFTIVLLCNFLYAEEVKQKTDDELIAEFMRLDQQIAEEKKKQEEAIAKTQAKQRELESAIKVNEKLDELLGVLSKDK